MTWLQENWIIAVVGLVVAVILLWWLFGRSKPEDIAPPAAEPAKPAKPLEPAKPEIIAAEPARFKPLEPKPQPVAPPPPEPVAKAPPAPDPLPAAEPVPEPPAPKLATKPKAAAKPAAKKAATKEPAAKPAAKAAPEAPAAKAKPAPAPAETTGTPAKPAVPPPTPPSSTKADNLQLLKGVGPKMVALLNGLGVTGFRQIADWTEADIAVIDPQLGAFQGRIARDNIVDQAGYLARGDKAGFEAKYGALGGEL